MYGGGGGVTSRCTRSEVAVKEKNFIPRYVVEQVELYRSVLESWESV